MSGRGTKRHRSSSDDEDNGRRPRPGGNIGPSAPATLAAVPTNSAAASAPPADLATARTAMVQALLPEAAPDHMLSHFLNCATLDVTAAIASFRAHRQTIFAPPPATSGGDKAKGNGQRKSKSPSPTNSKKASSSGGVDGGAKDNDGGAIDGNNSDEDKDPDGSGSEDDSDSESDDDKPDHIRHRYNNEKQRRRVATQLMNDVRKSFDGETITPTEAILLLVYYQWDRKMVVDVNDKIYHMQWRLFHRYDRMRAPIVINSTDTEDVKKLKVREQDERLALLIEATGRSDVHSLRHILKTSAWDLVDAISAWFHAGLKPLDTTQTTTTQTKGKGKAKAIAIAPVLRRNVNADEVPAPSQTAWKAPKPERGWGKDSQTFEPDPNDSEPDYGSDDEHLISNPPVHAPVPVINEDRSRLRVGQKERHKLVLQGISNGRYLYRRYLGPFKWPGLNKSVKGRKSTKKRNEEFDWFNKKHIGMLSRWRRQAINRLSKQTKVAASQPWSDEENKFVYDLTRKEVDRLMKETGKTQKEVVPLVVSDDLKKKWADALNKKFTGTKPGGAKDPRTDRTAPALMTQRCRLESMIQDFACKRDKTFFAKKAKADQNRRAAAKAAAAAGVAADGDDEEEEEEEEE
ncbi:hypothetical protein A1O1_03835 [Capronia coronata CBS 617.96]|uniref:Uncharacterized protein n=1 Tax=Capronia coronata CBS 617.96 TaxID=1182541 RepID=W9YNB3_9EURO|nr:uncharacterized protein A1O1_03835 [Capronia coronata CBS 617.96]EXJ90731.1 hypothetical protein A1O1_03835 [Capronia coronata CBS 617.96]